MDDKEKKHKLKELERTLAEELDPAQPPPSKAAAPPPKATIDTKATTNAVPKVTIDTTQPAAAPKATIDLTAKPGALGSVKVVDPKAPSGGSVELPPISIDEFDALLRESDPEFDKQVKAIGEGIKADVVNISIEKLNIDDLIQDEEDDGATIKIADLPLPPPLKRSR
ncbi:MAG: hypothetical protein ABL958_03440, partial [Bdellovibrionia bacterium]